MCNWISLYSWAMSEVMPEDRPSMDQINDDKQFDNWMEGFERKMAKSTAKSKKLRAERERKV